MASFQYVSDLHLEFYQKKQKLPPIKPCAPNLIIAGDLGDAFHPLYEQFLAHVSTLFTYVFLVSGNHEYYWIKHGYRSDVNQWMAYIETKIREIAKKYPNVIYLQNEAFVIPTPSPNPDGASTYSVSDIVVYGATMWSQIDDHHRESVRVNLNDYHAIPRFTIYHSNQLFHQTIDHLNTALQQYHDHQFIVITHHLPSYQLIHPNYQQSTINSAFASEVQLADSPQIIAWFAGHTHSPIDKGKFHVNPIGYRS
jgi:predicted phosphohydrolase